MSLASEARRRWLEGSTLGAGVLLMAALLAMLNYFGWKYHYRADWTASELYTLSEKSLDVIEALDRDVEVVVFMRMSDELYGPVEEILERYAAASSRISLRFVDPDRNPIEAQQWIERYEVQSLNVVVFDSLDDRRVVEAQDLAEYDYSGYPYGEAPEMTGFTGEQHFTSTLVELMDANKPKVLFTRGHGELDPDDRGAQGFSQARDLLGRDNFEIEAWSSIGEERVPEDTDLVVIAGPTEAFLEPEVALFAAYLEQGGRLLVLLDPTLSGKGGLVELGLTDWLAEFGVLLGDDLVIDPDNIIPFFGAETFFVDRYGQHEITLSLDQLRTAVIVPLARSVSLGELADGVRGTELLQTTEGGWGETNLADLEGVDRDDDDLAGPVSLAVALAWPDADVQGERVEGEAPGPADPKPQSARLVVVGDSDFAANAQVTRPGNSLMLSNTFNWLVERETLLGIPPKTPEQVRLVLRTNQLFGVYFLVLVLLPGLAIGSGFWVYLRRRR